MSFKNALLLANILVLCVFLFVSVFGISRVVATVGDVEEGKFIFSEGIVESCSDDGASGNTEDSRVDYLHIAKIDYYRSIQCVESKGGWYSASKEYSLDAGAPNSAYTLVTVKDGAVAIGTGNFGYGIFEDGGKEWLKVYLYMDSWNIGSRTGYKCLSLDYDSSGVYNLTVNRWSMMRNMDVDDTKVSFSLDTYYSGGVCYSVIDSNYKITHAKDWENDYYAEHLASGFYQLDITKEFGAADYESTWKVWTDGNEYLNATGSVDEMVMCIEAPIYINCTDVYDNFYSDILFTLPPGLYKVYGYAFDAKGGFLLPGVNTTFASGEYATDENGYYYYIVDAGEYVLTASRDGYQPLNYGAGVTLDVDSTMRYDIPLVKNETVYSGTTTVAGVVLDSVSKESVENALVWLENDSYDVYMYTNELGYFVFYNLTNTTYEIIASKSGYYTTQKDINLTDLDTGYYYQIDLVSKTVAAAPTPTPTSGADEKPIVSGIVMLFELFGLSGYMGYILALLCILAAGGTFGYITSGNTMAIAIGCFFGFVIDVALGWLPVWLVAVVLCVVIFLIVRQIREG